MPKVPSDHHKSDSSHRGDSDQSNTSQAVTRVEARVQADAAGDALHPSKKLSYAEWHRECVKLGINCVDALLLPFEWLPEDRGVSLKDVRLVSGKRCMITQAACWFCLRNKGDDGVVLYELRPFASREEYPFTVWIHCGDCREHALRSAAIQSALDRTLSLDKEVIPRDNIKVTRSNGEVQDGWRLNHTAMIRDGDLVVRVTMITPSFQVLSKCVPVAGVHRNNPHTVGRIQPVYPPYFPRGVQFMFEALLSKATPAPDTTDDTSESTPNKEESTPNKEE